MVARPALRYFGAKWRLAPWIISHFPQHTTYVEAFGGSGAVLLQKEPSRIEVYNDLDCEVVNFFRVLRDRPEELYKALALTPYAREEYETCRGRQITGDDLERARRLFVVAWQSFGSSRAQWKTGWKRQFRKWESGRADQIVEWLGAKEIMPAVERFLNVQIENRDALKIITDYDTPDTLFYLDPPYPSHTRSVRWSKCSYQHELSFDDHIHLCNAVCRAKGFVVLSSYPNPYYDEVLTGWNRVERKSATLTGSVAIEALYLSPRIVTAPKPDPNSAANI